MTRHASDQETPPQAPRLRTTQRIVLRYALAQILGGIALGFVAGVVFHGILRTPPSLLVRTTLAVLLTSALFWRQAKRHPEGYWTHGPLVAWCAALFNLLSTFLMSRASASTVILGSGVALATSFIAMALAGRAALSRGKDAGGVGA